MSRKRAEAQTIWSDTYFNCEVKLCNICMNRFPLAAFSTAKCMKTGLRGSCKRCDKEYQDKLRASERGKRYRKMRHRSAAYRENQKLLCRKWRKTPKGIEAKHKEKLRLIALEEKTGLSRWMRRRLKRANSKKRASLLAKWHPKQEPISTELNYAKGS